MERTPEESFHWHRTDSFFCVLGKCHRETDPVYHAVIFEDFSHSVGKHKSWWFTPAALWSVMPSAVVQHQSELAQSFDALLCQEKVLDY